MRSIDFEPNKQVLDAVKLHLKENRNVTTKEIIKREKKKGNILIRKTVENAIYVIKDEETNENAKRPMTLDDLLRILGLTVKHDNTNKLITFLSMLSAYTEDSQINVSYRAPSSSGKSYIPLELAYYFSNVIEYAGASPTSFVHDTGHWDDEREVYIVDLERKILIFIDMPHNKLLENLRPVLSHDRKELQFAITDRKEKHGIRTKHVIIRGFPTVIFCSGILKMNEQEATRSFVLSPEINEEKLREGVFLKAQRMGNPDAFTTYLRSQSERQFLQKRVELIRDTHINHVIIRDVDEIVTRFLKNKKLKPRHQRDIGRLIGIIQSIALLNLWHREHDDNGNIVASPNDVEDGFELWEQVSESQELGIPPYVYQFYKEIILPEYQRTGNGLSRKDILTVHFNVTGRYIPDWQLRQEILPALQTAGLIIEEQNPDDRRKTLVYPTPQLTISQNKDIVSSTMGKIASEPSQASYDVESASKAEISGDGTNAGLGSFVTNSVTNKQQEKGNLVNNDDSDAKDIFCHYHRDRKAVASVKDSYVPGVVWLCEICLDDTNVSE